ncbi:MAG: HAMP domain-containing histidine kinase [Gammaproteobacteria bacterium]|nr:HAMP domain-containing histidine kinase [Gammaproteobacteria bacterium]
MRTLFDLSAMLDRRRDHWVLALMLLVLHTALNADLESQVARALMTAHLGLFFLWQPIWQRDQRLDWPAVSLILIFTATFIGLLNGWLIFAWLILLIGIVAGRSRTARRERYSYMVTLAFLVSELLIQVVPLVFKIGPLESAVVNAFQFGLFVLPLSLLLLPAASPPRQTYPIEFFRGIIIALITALLAVGSVVITLQRNLDYPAALFVALLAVGAFLVFISWLITPATGTGLGALWEQSVLNIGTPFEDWITSLAQLAAREDSPSHFLRAAMSELTTTPWVRGANWLAHEVSDHCGTTTGRSTQIDTEHLNVTLYLDHSLGPALLLHCRLLIETLSHFYAAKLRERAQTHLAHLQAIHETGARLTHDIKNLLQSLKLMASATPLDAEHNEAHLRQLQRQLPLVVQRLQVALDKLNQPSEVTGETVALREWWHALQARHEGRGLRFLESIADPALRVPGECLDSVVENLLDNARQKPAADPLGITVNLEGRANDFTLSVTDSGAAIEAALVPLLFRQTVSSRTGLGIGLYQAYQQASRDGLTLALIDNREGRVCFAVTSRAAREDAPHSPFAH